MEIRFPRNIRLGFRPVYGLTLRQLLYLAVFCTVGGLVVLVGPLQGEGLWVRIIVGMVIICIGLTLAFLRVGGLALDDWIPIALRYFARPRRRVWRKRDVRRPVVMPHRESRNQPMAPTQPLAVPVAEIHISTAAIVLIDAAILVALIAMTVYMQQQGLSDVHTFLAQRLLR